MAHNPRVFFDFAVAGQPLGRVVVSFQRQRLLQGGFRN